MRILITIMLLWSSAIAFSQEIWQLSPWAPDSSYVIGAYPSGEPKWVKVDSLGVADSIYLTGDTIMLRDGSGSVILPCEQVYEIFIDKFTGVYTYPSEPVACGAFGYCEDPRTLFYYDGETWNIMVRDARITTSNDYPDKDEVIPLENADIYIDQDTTWFFTWENGWQIFSTKFKTDTLLITQIISDSLANITTEPDSIQRSGNIISLRDGSGSVDISDLVNAADSTSVLNSYGTIISETPANTFNVKVDSSLFATTYDITQIPTEPDSIQRSGNIISMRDGLGSVDVSDLVNAADSTIVQNSYGTIITESPTNTYNVKVDSSLFATAYDITQKINGVENQIAWFNSTNTITSSSAIFRNANGLNTSENFDINTTGGFKGLRRIMSGLNHGITNKLPTDMAWGFMDYSSTAYPNMYLVGVGKTSVPVMSFDLIRLDNPTSTYLNFELGYKNGVSTIAADPLSNLFRLTTGGQTKFNIFGNGDIRSYGALYNSSGSPGITGQALISQGSGAWTWSNVDASTTNELQNLSLSGQSLGISSGSGVTLPIVDVVAGSNVVVTKSNGVATVSTKIPTLVILDNTPYTNSTSGVSAWTFNSTETFNTSGYISTASNEVTVSQTGEYQIDMSMLANQNVDGGSGCVTIYPEFWDGSSWTSTYNDDRKISVSYDIGNSNNYWHHSQSVVVSLSATNKIRFRISKCSGYTFRHLTSKFIIKKIG